VDWLQLYGERADVAAYLTSDDFAADVADLLGRWDEPGRPALLAVRDWEPTESAWLYPEEELLGAFPDAPRVPAGPINDLGPGTLLVVVIDEEGETAYIIPDPRAFH
jgi:hypothetical protein